MLRRIVQINVIVELVWETIKFDFQCHSYHTYHFCICQLTHDITRLQFYETLLEDVQITFQHDSRVRVRIDGLCNVATACVWFTRKIESDRAIIEASPYTLWVSIVSEHGAQENVTTRIEGDAQSIGCEYTGLETCNGGEG